MVPNGTLLAAALLCTMVRYSAVPLDPASGAERIVKQVSECSACAILTLRDSSIAQTAAQAARSIGVLLVELQKTGSSANGEFSLIKSAQPSPRIPPPTVLHSTGSAEVLLLRTSGTVGVPKLVPFTRRRLQLAGAMIARSLQLTGEDVGLAMLPLHHVGGIACNLIAPLIAHSKMIFTSGFSVEGFFQLLDKITFCYGVPMMWQSICSEFTAYCGGSMDLTTKWPNLRILRSAGGALLHGNAVNLCKLFGQNVNVLPTYGMTEAMPIASPPLPYALQKPGSVGLPCALDVKIMNSEEVAVALPAYSRGEIALRGEQLFDGYLGSHKESFNSDGAFLTGDLGFLDGDGWLFVTGRIKETINRGGETISPIEVETAISSLPLYQQSNTELMVFACPHAELGEVTAVLQTLRGAGSLTQIRSGASRLLPPSMLPQATVLVPELPKSSAGKLQRRGVADALGISPLSGSELRVYISSDGKSVANLIEAWYPSDHNTQVGADINQYTAHPVVAANVAQSDQLLDQLIGIFRRHSIDPSQLQLDTAIITHLNSITILEMCADLSQRLSIKLFPATVYEFDSFRLLAQHCTAQVHLTCVSSVLPEVTDRIVAAHRETCATVDSKIKIRRCIVLHGEASNATLMKYLMDGLGWVSLFHRYQIELIFVESNERVKARPDLYPELTAKQLYESNGAYYGWGLRSCFSNDRSLPDGALHRCLDHLHALMTEHSPLHGLCGICDGALMAALAACASPDLCFFINICGSPVTLLPIAMRQKLCTVNIPSLHLIGRQDERLSQAELLSLLSLFEKAIVCYHGDGHTFPALTSRLETDIHIFLSAHATAHSGTSKDFLRSTAVVMAVDEDVDMDVGVEYAKDDFGIEHTNEYHASSLHAYAPFRMHPRAYVDSMTLLMEGGPEIICTANVFAICSTMVVFHHTASALLKDIVEKSYFDDISRSTSHLFVLMLGVSDHKRRLTWRQLSWNAFLTGIFIVMTYHGSFPELVQQMFSRLFPKGKINLIARLTAPSWWFIATIMYQLLDTSARSLRAPLWLLPASSVIVHFASFGLLLPWPLRRAPLHRFLEADRAYEDHPQWYLPLAQPLASLCTMWLYYTVGPLVLSPNFPAALPSFVPFMSGNNGASHKALVVLMGATAWTIRSQVQDFGDHPYQCAWKGWLPEQCIMHVHRLSHSTNHGWSFAAALIDAGTYMLMIFILISIGALIPRQRVPLLTNAGRSPIGVFIVHIFLTPFTDFVGNSLLRKLAFILLNSLAASFANTLLVLATIGFCFLQVYVLASFCRFIKHLADTAYHCLASWCYIDFVPARTKRLLLTNMWVCLPAFFVLSTIKVRKSTFCAPNVDRAVSQCAHNQVIILGSPHACLDYNKSLSLASSLAPALRTNTNLSSDALHTKYQMRYTPSSKCEYNLKPLKCKYEDRRLWCTVATLKYMQHLMHPKDAHWCATMLLKRRWCEQCPSRSPSDIVGCSSIRACAKNVTLDPKSWEALAQAASNKSAFYLLSLHNQVFKTTSNSNLLNRAAVHLDVGASRDVVPAMYSSVPFKGLLAQGHVPHEVYISAQRACKTLGSQECLLFYDKGDVDTQRFVHTIEQLFDHMYQRSSFSLIIIGQHYSLAARISAAPCDWCRNTYEEREYCKPCVPKVLAAFWEAYYAEQNLQRRCSRSFHANRWKKIAYKRKRQCQKAQARIKSRNC